VSRRKGQVYLTVVYDLERRVLLGVFREVVSTLRRATPIRVLVSAERWHRLASMLPERRNFLELVPCTTNGLRKLPERGELLAQYKAPFRGRSMSELHRQMGISEGDDWRGS
jgi:hypothetical protein